MYFVVNAYSCTVFKLYTVKCKLYRIGEKEESEYELRWSDHNAQVISVFYQLSQVSSFKLSYNSIANGVDKAVAGNL